jgi:hypothetical protein
MGRESPRADGLDELTAYTLSHGSPAFIHQHVVDAAGAQFADARAKPIRLVFSLVGLYLHLERGYTGREVQRVHMKMGERKRTWPSLTLPAKRGSITPADVLAAPPGPERDAAIDAWCASVWAAYATSRPIVIELLEQYGVR